MFQNSVGKYPSIIKLGIKEYGELVLYMLSHCHATGCGGVFKEFDPEYRGIKLQRLSTESGIEF